VAGFYELSVRHTLKFAVPNPDTTNVETAWSLLPVEIADDKKLNQRENQNLSLLRVNVHLLFIKRAVCLGIQCDRPMFQCTPC
jgi:hypothetical protein